jgi:hypothetical protein
MYSYAEYSECIYLIESGRRNVAILNYFTADQHSRYFISPQDGIFNGNLDRVYADMSSFSFTFSSYPKMSKMKTLNSSSNAGKAFNHEDAINHLGGIQSCDYYSINGISYFGF